MSSSHASSSAVDWRSSAVDHGGDDVAGLDRDVGAVIAARQLAQLGVHAVDERVDVAGEDPGHGRERM